jgi:ketosteroid isomerase-like protein
MRLRLVLVPFLGFVLSACTMWPEKRNPNWQQATGAEQFERLYWQELKAKNWKELEAHTASNFTHASAAGVRNKQETIATYKQNPLVDYQLGNFDVVAHGDTAIVNFTADFTYTDESGKTIGPVHNRIQTVWKQHKTGWVLLSKAAFLTQ